MAIDEKEMPNDALAGEDEAGIFPMARYERHCSPSFYTAFLAVYGVASVLCRMHPNACESIAGRI